METEIASLNDSSQPVESKESDNNETANDDSAKKEEEQELEQINLLIHELNTRFEQKKAERTMHNPKNFDYPDESFFVKLDSSIKKNSAFVKKLRNMTEAQKDIIMKDLASLNLSRYVSELACALVETKIKLNEIAMCLKICSFLHLRYQEFSSQLLDSWIKNLPRKGTETFNASKMRIDIRLFTELILSGIFSTKEALPMLGNLLTILTSGDKENHNNLSIVLGFCKQYGNEFAGLIPRKVRLIAEKHNLIVPVCDFLPVDRQRGVRNLLKDYFHSLVAHLTRDHKRLQNMDNDIKRILITRGEVSKHQKEMFENKKLEFQKLLSSAQQFAEVIDEDLPELSLRDMDDVDGLDPSKYGGDGSVVFDFSNRFRGDQSGGDCSAAQLWEDEETRTFYENFPDLKSIIPAILYKDSLKDATSTDATSNSEPSAAVGGDANGSLTNGLESAKCETNEATATKEINEEALSKEEEIVIDEDDFADSGKDMSNLNENDELEIALYSIQKTEEKKRGTTAAKGDGDVSNKPSGQQQQQQQKSNTANTAIKGQVEVFFASLLNCVNRDFIDKAALTFATTYNTKNNRKKLVNVLFTVPRTRLDLLPFYARFVAQLNPIMPMIGTDLVAILKHNFRYLFKKKDQINIESKVKNIRFIGELVKFGIFPKPDVLFILKTLLSDFRYHYVEMTCNLFETCGQYLYRSPDSYHLTNHLLDKMMRLKNRMALDSRYAIMIENAYYVVNPPEDQLLSRNTPTKPVMHLYIEHLIYKELAKSSVSRVLIKLRKLDWNNPEINSYIIKCLSSVWNIKYSNIVYLAHLLFGLHSYQEWVIPRVLDTVLEDIRLGLQINSLEFNQRRIAVIKFFAECFNYRLVDSSLLFRILYLLITFEVNYSDITQSPLDPPLNLMRLRLVAQILHTCGSFLTSGLSRKKLDYYLYFYQRYYWLKKSYLLSLPTENGNVNAQFHIDGIFKDVISHLKPKFKIADSYETACKQLETRLKEVTEKAKEVMPNTQISVNQVLNPNVQLEAAGVSKSGGGKVHPGLDPIVEEDFAEDTETANEVAMAAANGSDDRLIGDENNNDNNSSDEEEYCDDDEDLDGDDYDEKDASDASDIEAAAPPTPAIVECAEDDEFQRDFDKMITDCLTSRNQEVVRSNVEIVIPLERDDRKKKCHFAAAAAASITGDEAAAAAPFSMALQDTGDSGKQSENTVKFRVMARNAKSNKPLFRSIEVSPDSELVQNFLAREEALRAEKEAVKKIILDINQRRELEDSSGNSPSRSQESVNSLRFQASSQQQPNSGGGAYHRSGQSMTSNSVSYQQYRRRFN